VLHVLPSQELQAILANSNDSLISSEQTAFVVASKQGLSFTCGHKPHVAVETVATKSCFDLLRPIQTMKRSQISYLLRLPSIYFLKRCACFISNKTLPYRHVLIRLVSYLLLWNQLVYFRIHKSRIKDRILCHFGSLHGFAQGLFNVRGLVPRSSKN